MRTTIKPTSAAVITRKNGAFLQAVLLFLLLASPVAMADRLPLKPDKAYTFYLTQDRICRECFWRPVGESHVELSNTQGIRATYPREEIIGVDTHPVLRRLLRKSVHGIGLPGRVLVPPAFDDEKHLNYP